LAFQILFISITNDFSQVLQMQAPINFVFQKISFPQSAGTNWELYKTSQGMPVDQGINFSSTVPHFFSNTIEDRKDSHPSLEPTLSLEGPLPLSNPVQARHWPVDSLASVGDRNQLSSLMDQSAGQGSAGQGVTGQGMDTSGALGCQGDSDYEGFGTGGTRERPATGCVLTASPFASPFPPLAAPTTRGMTREKPGTDQDRPGKWKAQPLAGFSMDPHSLHSFCIYSNFSKTFNFSNNICLLCFPQFTENFTSFEKFETGIFQNVSFPPHGSIPPHFTSKRKTPPYGSN
jgi:hypothetical protein